MTTFEIPDAPTQHNLIQGVPMSEPDPKPSKTASELAQMIQQTQANLGLVLERVATATKRGLDDSVGVSTGGGEPVGGSRDFTQRMLDKLEQDDPAREHLSMLVASIGAVLSWSERAKVETFRLTPLSLEKAKKLLGDAPPQCINGNCGRDVWCTPQDRYLACRCEPCYKYWDRHGRSEERPKALCDATNRVHVDKKSATSQAGSEE